MRRCFERYVARQLGVIMQDWDEEVLFEDNRSREITISIDDYGPVIEARYKGNTIGKIEFEDYRDSIILAHASVEAEFQKSGIGTRMLKEFSELTDDWWVPNGNWSSATGHKFYLSVEGAALLNSCLRKKIINNKHEAPY